ncbi:46328_t:CDS:1, partial [Gigaspora margarita]
MEISEEDYKTIEENSSSLNITTSPIDICHKLCEFLTKNKQREDLDSEDRIEIKKKNRLFLEDYWEVHRIITYWYGHYLYNGIGGGKDEKKSINLFKQAAYKGYEEAINFCEENNIEYLISKNNYLKIFKNALKLHKSRNKSNKIDVEEKNRKLFTELYNNKYFELDSSGEIAYWIAYYSLKGYGSDKKLARDEALKLLKLAAKRGYNQAIEFCENNDIEYPISEKNYLKKFKNALNLYKSRNVSNKFKEKTCKLFTELYNKEYYKLDCSGEIAFWIFDYFKNGYGSGKKLTLEDKIIAIKSLE